MKMLLVIVSEFLVGEFFSRRPGCVVFFVLLMACAEIVLLKARAPVPFGVATYLVMVVAHGIGYVLSTWGERGAKRSEFARKEKRR